MKRLLLILVLLLTLLVGCTPDEIDAEIKDRIKDIPIPTMYDRLTGEPLVFDKITVKETTQGAPYSTRTGEIRRTYQVKALYEGYFWQGYRYVILVLWIPSEPSIYGSFKTNLTMSDIKNNIDELYWEQQ